MLSCFFVVGILYIFLSYAKKSNYVLSCADDGQDVICDFYSQTDLDYLTLEVSEVWENILKVWLLI